MLHVIANLEVEARLAGVTLPRKALQAIADAGTLLRALLPADATEANATLWLPAAVDPARLVDVPGPTQPVLARPRLAVGMPEHVAEGDTVVTWAVEDKNLHHRRLAHDLARRLGHAFPSARFLHSIEQLRSHLDTTGVTSWVVKAPYSAAGRDRHIEAHDSEPPRARRVSEQAETRVRRLLQQHRELLFEPWVDRDLGPDSLDFGLLGTVHPDGKVELQRPHRVLVDTRGRFTGIELGPLPWRLDEQAAATAAATAAGEALAAIGYHGPFGVDGYRYRGSDGTALQPLSEINARLTFGFVAYAVAQAVAHAGALPHTSAGSLKLCFGRDVPEASDDRPVVPLLRAGPSGRAAWVELIPGVELTTGATRQEPSIE